MSANGFLQAYKALLAKYAGRGSRVPLVPRPTGTDKNAAESIIFSAAFWPTDTGEPAEVGYGAFTGYGPTVEPLLQFTGGPTEEGTFAGYSPIVGSVQFFGGGELIGYGPIATPTFLATITNESFFTGYGPVAELVGIAIPASVSGFQGYGPKVGSHSFFGGGVFTGHGVRATLTATLFGSESAIFVGYGPKANLNSSAESPAFGVFLGYGPSASLSYSSFEGYGPIAYPVVFEAIDAVIYSEAFVMNLAHKEMPVTRYTNYPFMHVARIGDKHYGFATDGIYEITGDYDLVDTVPVNGTVTTQETDFGIFQSKNVPFVYLSADTDSTVTPIVDGEEQPSQTTDFSGRKCKLARGSKGRYWAMRIENITNLQGLEFLPDALQRRVK